MSKNEYINKLINAKYLKTDEDYVQFELALKQLEGKIQIEDVYDVCKTFTDNTNDEEVMFGVIHLLEQLQGEEYLKCIATCTPDMIGAHDWAMTLNKRILNSDRYYTVYIKVIKKLNIELKEKILKLLVDVKNDNPKRFGDKIEFILKEVKRYN